jgi:hypothetical protein
VVVLYVTLSMRVTMRRSTLFSGSFGLLKVGVAGALALATTLSCSDSTTAPAATVPSPLGGYTVLGYVPDSLKHSIDAVPASISFVAPHVANAMLALPVPVAALASTTPTYTASSVPFMPEPAPAAVPETFVLACDDCTHFKTEIGFEFTFYGKTYHQLNIVANGFVAFDSVPASGGCCEGGTIPFGGDAPYNNLIAIAWTDLNAGSAGASVRAETQGIAPHRKFVVQFTNVPEFSRGPGRVTAQLVLEEGSNDITIYTLSQNITTNQYHKVTQGIENADGSEAAFLPGRVHAVFPLTNDAVRFSIARPAAPPEIVPPADISVPTMAAVSSRLASTTSSVGTCDAVVNPGVATVTGDATGVTIAGARSDGASLDAVYPKGVTTITWTATNTAGLTSTASQKVTVEDKEKPVITAPADVSSGNSPGLASAVVAVGAASALDNCHDVSVESARNDGAALDAPYNVGATSIVWTARDAAGNTAAATQTVTVLDIEAPKVTVPADMKVYATSPAGAVANYPVLWSDNVRVTDISCAPVSGSMFPMGSSTVTCTASDAAGNQTSKSFNVNVVGPEEQVGDLIAYVLSLDLPNGTTNPLVNQLRAAFSADGSQISCTKMSDFISMVGNKVDPVAYDRESSYMLGEATRIMGAMGCSSSTASRQSRRAN